jgi:glycosyltransferase involved in cell wall biosynthesis
MELFINILLAVLGLLAAGLAGYWGVVAFHVLRTLRTTPTLAQAANFPEAQRITAGDAPSLCVILPAHNEEKCIGLLLDSLLRQDYPADRLRLVFALDRCTDGTRGILERGVAGAPNRTEIVEISECPAGWVGKVHALWEASRRARGPQESELLLFLDADTILEPPCVRAAAALLRERRLDMLSILSTLTSDKWFELVVQPAAAMELLRQYPIKRANDPTGRRPFANGQCILVRREAYEAIGGHESVKSELLEDVWLARQLNSRGCTTGIFLADGMLWCRMYSSWATFRRGWRRIFGESASRKPGRLRRTAWRQRLTGTVLPFSGPGAIAAGLWAWTSTGSGAGLGVAAIGTLGLVIWMATIGIIYHNGRVPLWAMPLAPIGSWMVGALQLEAARNLQRGEATHWGGLAYQQGAR